ncbi:MAG: peptidyl-prolyl cis-trans isomerase [Chloracidobacterium sp.]|uniref:Periplasmic chaperone PpiD n=1 Tax=Chloracidobacterium validum TaxID=2821543 RepID=A0ABX8BB82_9BACT|nr:peptidyl-prolyl cis-trans isomerase [Chloracidobacterium validum]QUW04194.1 peptidyl-prolyl cis-trans isomerase [Chloracidobacterium validum]
MAQSEASSANPASNPRRTLLIIVIFFLGLVMVLAYSLPSRSLFGASGPKAVQPVPEDTVIARVGSRTVTAKEYTTSLQNLVSMYRRYAAQLASGGGNFPLSIQQLRQQGSDRAILQQLVRRRIIELEAERLGLMATEGEIQQRLREQFRDENGRFIGVEKYKKQLLRMGTSYVEFERDLAYTILEEKLRNFITSGIQISPQEAEEEYRRQNTRFELSYVVLPATDFEKGVAEPTDEELRAYFDAHKEDFRPTKDRRKVRYIYVSQDKAAEIIPVSDEELQKEYDPNKQVKSVQVSQIVLKVLTPKDEDKVLQKANELVARARGKEGVPAEDFASLARGNSQDTATAAKGGDLGKVERSNVKPGEAVEAAFTLGVGEVSEPVRRGNAFYIFKVTDRAIKTFEEAKPGLLAIVRNRLSYAKASQLADEAVSLLSRTRNFEETAKTIAAKLNLTPDDVKRETPFFAPGDDVPDIGSNPSFEEKTSALTEPNDVGEKVGVRGGFAIPQLVEIKKPGDPTLDEVRDKVVAKVKQEKALQKAYDRAKELIAAAKNAAGLKSAAEAMKLKVEEIKDFNDTAYLDNKSFPAAFPNAEKVKVGELIPMPLYAARNAAPTVAVVAVTSRKDADLTKFAERRKETMDRLRGDRANNLFETYIDGVKARLKEAGQLRVDRALAERVVVAAAANEPAAE